MFFFWDENLLFWHHHSRIMCLHFKKMGEKITIFLVVVVVSPLWKNKNLVFFLLWTLYVTINETLRLLYFFFFWWVFALLQPAFLDGYEHFLCCRATLSLLSQCASINVSTPQLAKCWMDKKEGWKRAVQGENGATNAYWLDAVVLTTQKKNHRLVIKITFRVERQWNAREDTQGRRRRNKKKNDRHKRKRCDWTRGRRSNHIIGSRTNGFHPREITTVQTNY